MFMMFRHSWAYLFNDDPGRCLSLFKSNVKLTSGKKKKTEVVKLVGSTLPILGVIQVFESWSAVTGGILRAKGQQVLLFFCNFFFRIS